MRNEPWIHTRSSYEISTSSVPWIRCECLRSNFIHSKIFSLIKYREVLVEIFTAHYKCRNADLNLTLVTGTTNRFIFQIIDSLIESWPAWTVTETLSITGQKISKCFRNGSDRLRKGQSVTELHLGFPSRYVVGPGSPL